MTMTAHKPKNEAKLDSCRESLDKVIEATAREEWGAAKQWESIRRDAVLGAVEEGFPVSSISEASGVPEAEIRHMVAESR